MSISEFADKINQVLPFIMKEFARINTKELYKEKITMPQFFVLVLLEREGEVMMSALAHSMGITTAAMTGVADRLVKYGYIQRVYDPSDRRIIKVRVTTKGTNVVKKLLGFANDLY